MHTYIIISDKVLNAVDLTGEQNIHLVECVIKIYIAHSTDDRCKTI